MKENQKPIDSGISSAELDAIHSLAVLLPSIVREFDWYGLRQFLRIRQTILQLLEIRLQPRVNKKELALRILQENIENNALRIFDSIYSEIINESSSPTGMQYSVIIPKPGSSLTVVLNFFSGLILSLQGMSKALRSYLKTFNDNKKTIARQHSQSSKTTLDAVIKQIIFILPHFKCSIHHCKENNKQIRKTLRRSLSFYSHYVRLVRSENGYAFKVSSKLLTSNCVVSSEIKMDDDSKILSRIVFNDVIMTNSGDLHPTTLHLNNCSGGIRFHSFKEKNQLRITHSPNLSVIITNGGYADICVSGGIESVITSDSIVKTMHCEGNTDIISFDRCNIDLLTLSESHISELRIKQSTSHIAIKHNSHISEVEISAQSLCPVTIIHSKIAKFVVADSSVLGYTDRATIGTLAFPDRSSMGDNRQTLSPSVFASRDSIISEVNSDSRKNILEKLESGHDCRIIIHAKIKNGQKPQRIERKLISSLRENKSIEYLSSLTNKEDLSLIHKRTSQQLMTKKTCKRNTFWDTVALFMASMGINPWRTLWGLRERNSALYRYTKQHKHIKFATQHLYVIFKQFLIWRNKAYPTLTMSRIAKLPKKNKIFLTQMLEKTLSDERRKRQCLEKPVSAHQSDPHSVRSESKSDAHHGTLDGRTYASIPGNDAPLLLADSPNLDGYQSTIAGLKILAYACAIIQSYPVKQHCFSRTLYRYKLNLMQSLKEALVSEESIKKRVRLCLEAIHIFEIGVDNNTFIGFMGLTSFLNYIKLAKLIILDYFKILLMTEQTNRSIQQAFEQNINHPRIIEMSHYHKQQVRESSLTQAVVKTYKQLGAHRENPLILKKVLTRMKTCGKIERLISKQNNPFSLKQHLKNMAGIAASYRPIFSFFGLGRKKRLILLFIVKLLSNRKIPPNSRLIIASNILSFLSTQSPRISSVCSLRIQKGARLWSGNSRRVSGYRSKIALLKELTATLRRGNPSWPTTRLSQTMLHSVSFYEDPLLRAQNRLLGYRSHVCKQ